MITGFMVGEKALFSANIFVKFLGRFTTKKKNPFNRWTAVWVVVCRVRRRHGTIPHTPVFSWFSRVKGATRIYLRTLMKYVFFFCSVFFISRRTPATARSGDNRSTAFRFRRDVQCVIKRNEICNNDNFFFLLSSDAFYYRRTVTGVLLFSAVVRFRQSPRESGKCLTFTCAVCSDLNRVRFRFRRLTITRSNNVRRTNLRKIYLFAFLSGTIFNG